MAGRWTTVKRSVWLAVVLLSGGGPDVAGGQPTPHVAMQRLEDGRWRATWELAEPAPVLRFDRPAQFYREHVWTIVTEGYRFGRTRGWQVLEVEPGATPRATITVEFPEYTQHIPKEYELFQPFGDGAVALYTGHFYASPRGAGVTDSTVIRTIRLTPPPGARAIVRGEIREGPFDWSDAIGDGTYVYLGTTDPIETEDLVAIVDAHVPAWLGEEMYRRLPELFAAYARRLEASLPWKPLVFYSFDAAEAPGLSSSGGTLTGLIQMTLSGTGWLEQSPGATEHALQFLAHEAAHLWNGQLVTSAGGGASWMHEGAADAMARDLLLAFGVIDLDGHRAGREAALNQCFTALALGDGPIATAHERGAFRLFYDCGEVMALWTDAALRRVNADADLFTFWRDLIHAARAGGGTYDVGMYFRVLADRGVPRRTRETMGAFLSARPAVEIGLQGLRAAGIDVRPGDGTPPPTVGQELVRRVVMHLMRTACGRVSFWAGDPMVTAAIPDCAPFATEHRVHAIQGERVGGDAGALYDAVAAACRGGSPVRLEALDGSVLADVVCSAALPDRPPWYVL